MKSSSDIDKVVICITVIKKLTTKRVLGNNELPQELLMELLSIFDKLSQTEDVFVQAAIMECMNHFVVQFGESNFEDAHGNLKEHHYRILRIIHLGLANFIPGLTANPNAKSNQCFDDVVSISKALSMETISIISQSLQQFQSLLEYGLLGVAAKRYISCFVLTVTCCIASITVVILDDQRLSVVIPNFLAAFKSALQQADNATFVRASLDVILSKLKICWLIKSFNTSVNLKNEDSLVFKNLTLALVLTLSIFPKSYHYSVQKSVDKCLAEIFCCSEVSMDVLPFLL